MKTFFVLIICLFIADDSFGNGHVDLAYSCRQIRGQLAYSEIQSLDFVFDSKSQSLTWKGQLNFPGAQPDHFFGDPSKNELGVYRAKQLGGWSGAQRRHRLWADFVQNLEDYADPFAEGAPAPGLLLQLPPRFPIDSYIFNSLSERDFVEEHGLSSMLENLIETRDYFNFEITFTVPREALDRGESVVPMEVYLLLHRRGSFHGEGTTNFFEMMCNKKDGEEDPAQEVAETTSVPIAGGVYDIFSKKKINSVALSIFDIQSRIKEMPKAQKSEVVKTHQYLLVSLGFVAIGGLWTQKANGLLRLHPLAGFVVGLFGSALAVKHAPDNCLSGNFFENLQNLSAPEFELCLESSPEMRLEARVLQHQLGVPSP